MTVAIVVTQEIMVNSASDRSDSEDKTDSHSDGSGTEDIMTDCDSDSSTESNLDQDQLNC